MSKQSPRVAVAALSALVTLITLAGCTSGEHVAPADSTLELNATPGQIILIQGVQASPVTLVATVRDKIGVPLPDQDVRFTSDSGTLTPKGQTPIRTDEYGNATCELNQAQKGPVITATSGKATDSLTIQAATGQIAAILLGPDPIQVNQCTFTVDYTATVSDPKGLPVKGVIVEFKLTNPTSTTEFLGTFNPSSGLSDVNGEVTTTLTIDTGTCPTRCTGGPDCSTTLFAQTQGGGVQSSPVTLQDTF